jgi:hypothetical protein
MTLTNRPGYGAMLLLTGLLSALGVLRAADASNGEDIATLKTRIAAQEQRLEALELATENQQKVLEEMRATIADQRKMLEQVAAYPAAPARIPTETARPARLGEVASLTPVIPAAAANPALPVVAAQAVKAGDSSPCEAPLDTNKLPPYLRLGSVCIQPVGFLDFESLWRDKDTGSGIATNIGNFPYNNTTASKLSEFRLSAQFSRIGSRVDGSIKGIHFIGYNEFDFLSTATATASGVTSGAFVPRLRLFFVDLRKGKFELMAGQNWSMLTPNRNGLSVLQPDLFYAQQMIDPTYIAGLTYTRQPGIRFLYHPSDQLNMGISLENPNQYIGGAQGGSGITLPAASTLAATAGAQLDNTTGAALSTPNLTPDIIGKVAYEPNSRMHFEADTVVRTFRIWNAANNTYSTISGVGGGINANFQVAEGLRAFTNNFYGAGVGRYLIGQAPDVVVGADGFLKTVSSAGFVEGLEYTRKNWLYYAYYGNIYIDRRASLDADGKTPIGFGYTGAPNSQNRNIHEITFGFNQTLWKDPRFGALNFMGEYEYLLRHPWYVAKGAPKAAHDNTIYFDLRYTLPGSMPKF